VTHVRTHYGDSATTSDNQPSFQPSGPAPGARLKGRYQIERELGRGGVGVVYLARDERLHGMPVVIKFLLETAERSEWLTRKFSQEAEALTRINHPGVVRVIDRDLSDDGRPFFVMELVKGRPLRVLMNSGPMNLDYVAQIVRQMGNALFAAHQQGVFHRDLKPENIMLEQLSDGEEQIKLIDFGIAKVVNPQAGTETEVAIVAGSRQYIAPEQLLTQVASAATDIYAIAIIVYEMVTGHLPFNPQGSTHFLVMQELMRLQQTESFVKPQLLRPDLPEAAQILLINALSFDQHRRPQNARIFAGDLAQALTGNIKIAGERATVAVAAAGEIRADAGRGTLPVELVATAPNEAALTNSTQPKGRKIPLALSIIAGLIIVSIAAGIAVKKLSPGDRSKLTPETTQSPTLKAAQETPFQQVTPGPPVSEDQRVFNYWITWQKDPRRYPDSRPEVIAGETYFTAGDRVHISFLSPQPGYLYIINESPSGEGQTSSFNLLFPTSTSNNGSAQVPLGRTVRIPDHDIGFVFDVEQGTEKLWLIWAAGELPALDALKSRATPQNMGAIEDTAQIESLRAFLGEHSVVEPQVNRDETSKRTTVTMKGDILVKLIKLQHF
jgi:serine/threonine protein kinase